MSNLAHQLGNKRIPVKTPQGVAEISNRAHELDTKARTLLIMLDGRSEVAQLEKLFSRLGDISAHLDKLQSLGLVATATSVDEAEMFREMSSAALAETQSSNVVALSERFPDSPRPDASSPAQLPEFFDEPKELIVGEPSNDEAVANEVIEEALDFLRVHMGSDVERVEGKFRSCRDHEGIVRLFNASTTVLSHTAGAEVALEFSNKFEQWMS